MAFIMQMAAVRSLPEWQLKIRHTVATGLFFTFEKPMDPTAKMGAEQLDTFETELRRLVAKDYPILRRMLSYEEAMTYFSSEGRHDKVLLLQHHNTPFVATLCCDGFMDLHAFPVVASTGSLGVFSFTPYEDGCVINLPNRENSSIPMEFVPQKELIRVHREHTHWGNILGVRSVGELNQAVFDRRISDVIMMSEALHNKKFAELATNIIEKDKRLVLIAGPSSAGKTTSAKRLMTHLKVNGKTPVVISTDDYFVGDDHNPIGPDGKPDYEHINALDLDNFNEHLTSLLAGKKICRRIFNFLTKEPEFTKEELQLGPDDVLIVEGIHGLNPMLTEAVPREEKFLIYLTQGLIISVVFMVSNSARPVTLNVNGLGKVDIKTLSNGYKDYVKVFNGDWNLTGTRSLKSWGPYTVLNLVYDGMDFIIIGNPILLNYTSDTINYRCFADGTIEQWNSGIVERNTTVNLLVNYTSADSYNVQATTQSSSGNNSRFSQVGFRNRTMNSFIVGANEGDYMTWRTIGY